MSDTPRTDAEETKKLGGWSFARTLERELSAVTRERDEAYERGLQEGRIDLTKIVRKWDSECLDPPEVEGLRDYAMLDGERLETLWRALELSLAREMQTARERDEAHAALKKKGEYGYSQFVVDALSKERDALRAEVASAKPAMREYAAKNPRHLTAYGLQDPSGAHAWLERNDKQEPTP